MYGKEYIEWKEKGLNQGLLDYLIAVLDAERKNYLASGELTEYGRGVADGMSRTRALIWCELDKYVKDNLPSS